MAQLLDHQDSLAIHNKKFQGCNWMIPRLLGFLSSRKSPSDKQHIAGKGDKLHGSYYPLDGEAHGAINDSTNSQLTKKGKSTKKKSKRIDLSNLFLKKLYGRQGQKQKILPVTPRLLRTISIHYLQRSNHVLNGASLSDASSEVGDDPPSSTFFNTTLHGSKSIGDQDSQMSSKAGEIILTDTLQHSASVKVRLLEDKKELNRISMDALLHRVPYGQKVPHVVSERRLFRSASVDYDSSGSPDINAATTKKYRKQGFNRSRSLTDDIERYSHLLDPSSSREQKKLHASVKEIKDGSLMDQNPHNLVNVGSDQISVVDVLNGGVDVLDGVPLHSANNCDMLNGKIKLSDMMLGDLSSDVADVVDQPDCVLLPDQINPDSNSIDNDCAYSATEQRMETETDLTVGLPDIRHLGVLHNANDISSKSTSTFQGYETDEKFDFVRNVFEKSNLSSGELFSVWYCLHHTSLLQEDCQPYEVGVATFDFSNGSVDDLLLFDLTSELLLEFYKRSFHQFPNPSGTNFLSGLNTTAADYILKELWTGVRHYLDMQLQPGLTIDRVIAGDFDRYDGWRDRQINDENTKIELASMILDILVMEVTLELANL